MVSYIYLGFLIGFMGLGLIIGISPIAHINKDNYRHGEKGEKDSSMKEAMINAINTLQEMMEAYFGHEEKSPTSSYSSYTMKPISPSAYDKFHSLSTHADRWDLTPSYLKVASTTSSYQSYATNEIDRGDESSSHLFQKFNEGRVYMKGNYQYAYPGYHLQYMENKKKIKNELEY